MERRLTGACVDELVGAAVERMLRRDAEFAVVHDGSRPSLRDPRDEAQRRLDSVNGSIENFLIR